LPPARIAAPRAYRAEQMAQRTAVEAHGVLGLIGGNQLGNRVQAEGRRHRGVESVCKPGGNRKQEMKVYRSHSPDREYLIINVAIIIKQNIIIINIIIHRLSQACASFLKNTSTSSIFLFSCCDRILSLETFPALTMTGAKIFASA
jgi:hypothetical protein